MAGHGIIDSRKIYFAIFFTQHMTAETNLKNVLTFGTLKTARKN